MAPDVKDPGKFFPTHSPHIYEKSTNFSGKIISGENSRGFISTKDGANFIKIYEFSDF